MKVVKGEYYEFDLPIKDSDGDIVTNLGTATVIKLEVKEFRTDTTALISITDAGTQVLVDTPITGTIRIKFLPADTVSLTTGKLYFECEITYSATDIRKVRLTEDEVAVDTFDLVESLI